LTLDVQIRCGAANSVCISQVAQHCFRIILALREVMCLFSWYFVCNICYTVENVVNTTPSKTHRLLYLELTFDHTKPDR
jgi:hypothetical protein